MNIKEYIEPEIARKTQQVKAFFTLRDDDYFAADAPGAALRKREEQGLTDVEIKAQRNLLFKVLDLEPAWTAWARQVHGTKVQVVSDGGLYAGVDALVTQIPGLALLIQVADCAAVLLADVKRNMIAAAHAGWRGAAGGIIPGVLNSMQELGANPADIVAYISPCISVENFEVGEDVAGQFPDRFVNRKSYSKPHVNLKEFIRYQLLETGLNPRNIEVDNKCTMEEDNLLYSYRREKEQSGRMLALIQLNYS